MECVWHHIILLSDPLILGLIEFVWSTCTQAVKYIEYDTSFGDEEKKQAKALKVACNLNNAACKLKLKDYKQAEKLCTKVQQQKKFLLLPIFNIYARL